MKRQKFPTEFKNARDNLWAEKLVYQLPRGQVEEMKMDLITIGIAKVMGEEHELLAKRTANKYTGRKRKLFDILIRERMFEACVDAVLAGLPDSTDQPVGDATVELSDERV